jgi:hypothetical protein
MHNPEVHGHRYANGSVGRSLGKQSWYRWGIHGAAVRVHVQ